MKQKTKNGISLGALLCTVYLCLLGTALPLTVHDAYFDITRTKATVFWLLSGLLALGWVLRLFVGSGRGSAAARPALCDALIALFALCPILSSLLLQYSADPLLAPDNRYQGVLSYLCYFAVFLILRRDGRFSTSARFALLLGCSLAALLGVLDVFNLSVLPLRAVSPEIELPRFVSTVGNISFLSALCVLFLPIASWYALSAKDGRAALPYALCALLALCGGLASRAESFLLGSLFFFAALPLFSRHETALRRVPLLWALAAAAAFLFTLAMNARALYRPSELTRLLCAPAPMLAVCALSAAILLWLRRKEDRFVLRVRKVYIIIFWALAAAAALLLLLANTLWREAFPAPLGAVAVFSPSWGSDRGAEWMSFWQMFLSSPLPQKLIGSGAGSLAAWDSAHPLFPDAVTDSAHNEYLHYLLTGGVIGLGAYLALLGAALRRALRRPTRERTALALACAAYAVQAAVNIAQPFTTPLLFSLLALLFSERAPEGDAESGPFWYVALCALAAVLLVAAAA